MMSILLFLASILVFIVRGNCEGVYGCPDDDWSYHDPKMGLTQRFWGLKYPACYDSMQSPISIEKTDNDQAIYSPYLKPLHLYNYDQPVTKALFENDGHTVKIIPKDGIVRSFLVNSPFTYEEGTKFTLDEIQIHSAEHIIRRMHFNMEVQFFHSDKNGSIAVLSSLFEMVDEPKKENEAFKTILENFSSVMYKNEQYMVEEAIHLDQLVQNNTNYYRYTGSLSAPPCTGGVSWTISKRIQEFNGDKWHRFGKPRRTVKDYKGKYYCGIFSNGRYEQLDYERPVFEAIMDSEDDEHYPWN